MDRRCPPRRLAHHRSGAAVAPARLPASISATYISQLESADAAPGIDLVDRLAKALGIVVAELLPAEAPPDTLAILQGQAKRLFDQLLRSADREAYLILNPLLAQLLETVARRR